jgi:hypothetical protein
MLDLPSVVVELLLKDTESIGRKIAAKQASGFELAHGGMAAWRGG